MGKGPQGAFPPGPARPGALFPGTRVGAAVAWDGVLVRFGEIGIKSAPVRRAMVNRLRDNLMDRMVADGVEGDVQAVGSRLWLAGPDPTALADCAARVFGVVSASIALRTGATMQQMGEAAARVALEVPWTSFAVRSSREGTHTFSSQEVAVQVGSIVWKAAEAAGRKVRVDLSKPDLEVHVEVRGSQAFVYAAKLPGPGGIPTGSQGAVVALISDRPSFVAAWLAMRRGCHVIPLHAGTTGSVPVDAVAALARWGLPRDVEVLPVCTGAVTKEVLLAAAATIANERGAQALVTGDTLSSSLLAPPGMAVLRPVCGLDPARVEAIAQQAGVAQADEAPTVLAPASRETVESLLSMRRVASA